jgi:hypothetical protein
MSHWAELNDNNIVLRVLVGDNNDPNGDEGYQWLIDNLGSRWLKCSYNTLNGTHLLGGEPFRWTYPGPGHIYFEDIDSFVQPSKYKGWILNKETKEWEPPTPKPDSGIWIWNDETESWVEGDIVQ